MLSPTSLAGLSISPSDWARPIRAVSPAPPTSSGAQQLTAPLSLLPQTVPNAGGQPDGGALPRNLPRGSVLDLSV
jgi:hypothetical protein